MQRAIKRDGFESLVFQSITKEPTLESVFDGIYFVVAHVAATNANHEFADDFARRSFYKNLEEIGNALYQYSIIKESAGLDKVRGFVSIMSIGAKLRDLLSCADCSGEIQLALDDRQDKDRWNTDQWHWLQFNKVGLSVIG